MQVPVISSVGHETDNTLADFVADRRAATPTAAAELATPVTLEQVVSRLNELQIRLNLRMKQLIDVRRQRVDRMIKHVIFQQPDRLYIAYNQRVDQLSHTLMQVMQQRLTTAQHQLMALVQRQLQVRQILLQRPREQVQLLTAKLDLVSPLKILTRGYVLIEKDSQVVRTIKVIHKNDTINLRLSDGTAKAKIIETSGLENE